MALPLMRISPRLPHRFGARGLSLPCWRTTSTGSLPRNPPQAPRQAGHHGLLSQLPLPPVLKELPTCEQRSLPQAQSPLSPVPISTWMPSRAALPRARGLRHSSCCPSTRTNTSGYSSSGKESMPTASLGTSLVLFSVLWGVCPPFCSCGLRPAKDQRFIRVKIKFSLIETYNGLIM